MQEETMLCGKVSGHDVTVRYDSQDGPSFFIEIRLSSGRTLRQRIPHDETSPPDSQDHSATISTMKRRQPEGEGRTRGDRTKHVKRMRMISADVFPSDLDSNLEVEVEENINSVLPPEVLSMILGMASSSSGRVMSIVGSFVCRLWRQLLHHHLPVQGKYYRAADKFTTLLTKQGWLSLLQWARQQGCKWDEEVCSSAAKIGRLDILKWARAKGCLWNGVTCLNAAREGHMEILKWAREAGCNWTELTASAAAWGGHGEVLKWLKANGCPWGSNVVEALAGSGNLELLKWAVKEEGPHKLDAYCFYSAVSGGNIEMLEWLKANVCDMSQDLNFCNAAARKGNVKVLEWLLAEGFPLTHKAKEEAIKEGHLEMLKWLLGHGCSSNFKHDYELAAKHRNSEVFKWLVEQQKSRWNEEVSECAASMGDLEVLKWLREEGCPWNDENVVFAAVTNGHFEMLKWANQIGCRWPDLDPWTLLTKTWPTAQGREVLQWIYDQDHFCDTNDFVSSAVGQGNLAALQWSHQMGMRGTSLDCKIAAEQGRLDLLKLLRRVGTPWDRSVLDEAVKRKNLKMLKWIFLHGGAELTKE